MRQVRCGYTAGPPILPLPEVKSLLTTSQPFSLHHRTLTSLAKMEVVHSSDGLFSDHDVVNDSKIAGKGRASIILASVSDRIDSKRKMKTLKDVAQAPGKFHNPNPCHGRTTRLYTA